jgi:hypothetical protein
MGHGKRSDLGMNINNYPGPGAYQVAKSIKNYRSQTTRNAEGKKISLTVSDTQGKET